MDEKLTDETVEAAVPAADQGIAADTAAATEEKSRELSINELEKLDDLLPVERAYGFQITQGPGNKLDLKDLGRHGAWFGRL